MAIPALISLAFLIIGSLSFTGCVATPAGGTYGLLGGVSGPMSNPMHYVQTHKGEGTRKTLPGPYETVYEAMAEMMGKDPTNSDPNKIITKEDHAIYVKSGLVEMVYAAYFYPTGSPEKTDVEYLIATPWMDQPTRKRMEEGMLQGAAEAIELKVLRSKNQPGYGAAKAQPAPAAPATPAAEQAKPRRISSDVDHFGRPSLPSREDDLAVVVGVESYLALPAADHAERDAQTVKKYLLGLGVPEENLILLTGPRATRTGLAKYLEEWLPRNVTPQSRVYFFYSGHGAPDPSSGSAYLLPWDGDPSFLQSSAYPISRLYERLQALKAREVLVALDACFSGAGGRSVIAKGSRPLVNVAAAPEVGSKLSVFSAASAEEITGSFDEQGHGLFTYYFLKGLKGEGDADQDGHISLAELQQFIQKNVQRAARRQNREQTPQLHSAGKDLRIY